MGWKDLLQQADETLVVPWLGGRSFQTASRSFEIEGRLPQEVGWQEFNISGGRKVRWKGAAAPKTDDLKFIERGYLVGDHLVRDEIRVEVDPAKIYEFAVPVALVEEGFDRFTRVSAGSLTKGGPLVFIGQEMPLGPETDVLNAFLDNVRTLKDVKGVPPALDAAFRVESWQRAEVARRRAEAERRQREEEERRAAEERRRQLAEQLGTGAGRREMARVDFGQAARAALAVGEAEYLDHRRGLRRGEMVVKFRLDRRRFECTCNEYTLQIIDAGICLTAHYDDEDFAEGTRGDTFFTLESLPAVIRQAEREHRLVVLRRFD